MVKESTIRLMTRLANEYGAVNLSQGFTDEPAIYEMVWGGISASLGGTEEGINRLEGTLLRDILKQTGGDIDRFLDMSLKDILKILQQDKDAYNQYSYPFGLPELRKAIADYTYRFQGYRPDSESEITVVLGATEGLYVSLLTLCNRGDKIIVMQPFHEMYIMQAEILGLDVDYVTLIEDKAKQKWVLDFHDLQEKITENTRALVLNTPHNPTGKVFSFDEMKVLADICVARNIFVITDEIYEHILYNGRKQISMAAMNDMRAHTFVVNSASKTGYATGWRVGWVISPLAYTTRVRAFHDTMVVQAPTPLQKGVVRLLNMSETFYSDMPALYADKKDLLSSTLKRLGFSVTSPEGSYYLFAGYSGVPAIENMSPMEAATFLIKQVGVASVPGDNFYKKGHTDVKYLRFAFCRCMESLEEAAGRLKKLSKWN